MIKKYFYIAIGIVAVGFAFWWRFSLEELPTTPALTDEDISKLMADRHGTPAQKQIRFEKIAPEKRVRVAIGGIGLSPESNARLSDLILVKLSSAKGLEFVERQSLDLALRELQLNQSGVVRAKDAIRLGKLVRADWFLLGTPVHINGTNSIINRIVDARSGILLDAAAFPSDVDLPVQAESVAGFLSLARERANNPKPMTYLSVGTFQDVGLNSRQAALPRELRSYLTAAFQNSRVTLLEREFAGTLLHEIHLDLAGLTESATNSIAPMQSAYWMLDGFYQSYETKEFEVELVVNVRRMFGRNQQIELRDKPGEPLFRRVKEAVEQVISKDNAAIAPTRQTELKAQLESGEQLSGFHSWMEHLGNGFSGSLSAHELARRKRNTEEAIRAFQTALLLDPENREAKISLASCYRWDFIGRLDESREFWRQVIEAGIEDRWADIARRALVYSFQWEDPGEKRRYFASVGQTASNPSALAYYKQQLKISEEEMALAQPGTSQAEKVAEERLFQDIRKWDSETQKRGYMVDFYNTGLGKYVEAFGTNKPIAAARLLKLLPRLQEVAPSLSPHLQAGVVSFQTDTNAPIISEFEHALAIYAEEPEKISSPDYYFKLISGPVCYWARDVKLPKLTTRLLAARQRAHEQGYADAMDDELTMTLAYGYLETGEWREALNVFQTYSNRPVWMTTSGRWGKTFTPVLPSKQVAYCQEKLGLTITRDPREVDMETNVVCMHTPSAFLAVENGLWLGIDGKLIQIDYAFKTNRSITLPMDSSIPVNLILAGSTNLWIATDGAGLIDFEKSTGNHRRIREQDGLLMNSITALHQTMDTLWIGYGSDRTGGLGKLDLKTGRVTSFTASLLNTQTANQPTRNAIAVIAPGLGDELWILTRGQLSQFDFARESWETRPLKNGEWIRGIATDGSQLFRATSLAQSEIVLETKNAGGTANGISRQTIRLSNDELVAFRANLKTNKNARIVNSTIGGLIPSKGTLSGHRFSNNNEMFLCDLPNPATILKFLDREIWVGGCGFIACVDAKSGSIRKIAYVPAEKIEDLQIGGGFLWAKFNKHLHRVSLGAPF